MTLVELLTSLSDEQKEALRANYVHINRFDKQEEQIREVISKEILEFELNGNPVTRWRRRLANAVIQRRMGVRS